MVSHRFFGLAAIFVPVLSPLCAQDAIENKSGRIEGVVSSVTWNLGDRLVTMLEVTKVTLPSPPPKVEAPAPRQLSADEQAAWQTWAEQQPKLNYLSLGGIVYRSASHPTRSFIRCFAGDGAPPIAFWSSFDWQLFQDGNFTLPNGSKLSLLLMLSVQDEDAFTALYHRWGGIYTPPAIPSFPAGAASFKVVSGEPTFGQLAYLEALHALYDRDYDELVAAFEQRKTAQIEAKKARAEEEAKPPENVVIRYRVMTPDELEDR